jgi:hypothetical protein
MALLSTSVVLGAAGGVAGLRLAVARPQGHPDGEQRVDEVRLALVRLDVRLPEADPEAQLPSVELFFSQ